MRMMGQFARYLAERGIGAAVMDLPYHMHRRAPGVGSGGPFTDPDVNRMIQAASQSASDVSTVVTWLSRQPSVDPRRIGVLGVSLGAMIAHLAMGKDERLSAGVAILGGGNLADLRRASLVFKIREHDPPRKLSLQELDRLDQVDPLHYASRNQPRRVLMIQAARDLLVPPRDARVLWEALGRPPIVWVDTNHFGLSLTPRSVVRTSAAYLWSVWNEAPRVDSPLPAIHAITLKLGIIAGLGARPTPALQWQAWSFASRRNHMSLLHTDLGWSGRGPFIGLAGTVNGFMDLGLGHRFSGGGIRPYFSLHIVF
jgi:dienelactone hydrolase